MAERVTKKQIGLLFASFCRANGLKLATSYKDVGGFALDEQMGWKIVQIDNTSGAERSVFGDTRYTAREFADVLRFGIALGSYHRKSPSLPGRPYSQYAENSGKRRSASMTLTQRIDNRRKRGAKFTPPYHVDVWEERDRLQILLRDSLDNVVAAWEDDDARQMFEDGFFKRGRELNASVLAYAKEMGMT